LIDLYTTLQYNEGEVTMMMMMMTATKMLCYLVMMRTWMDVCSVDSLRQQQQQQKPFNINISSS